MAKQFLSVWKRFQFDNKSSIPHSKLNNPISIFLIHLHALTEICKWWLQERGGFLWHRAATLQGGGHLHSKSCNPLPARDDLEPKTKRAKNLTWCKQPFCFLRFPRHRDGRTGNTPFARGIITATQPGHRLLSFILFLFTFFINYSDFFVLLFPPLKGNMALKTEEKKIINHKENILFSRSTVSNRHKSLEAQETFLNILWTD